MPGAPKAASASPSEPLSQGRRAWSKPQRLLRAREFACLSHTSAHWRASRRYLALSAQLQPPVPARPIDPAPAGAVRFGFTVSRHQARRAVARNAVKRVLREAARHGAGPLREAAAAQRLDILLRLKAPLPDVSAASWSAVKAALRREADSLITQLHRLLLAQSAGDTPPSHAQCLGAST